ncbi:MAG: tetratricopeptide repeat protein, partial [Chitinophagales bacterium]
MSQQSELKLAQQYLEKANGLRDARKFEEAMSLFQQTIVLYERWKAWKEWIEANIEMGHIYSKSMKYEQGLKHLQGVLDSGKRYLGEEHPVLGDCIYEIGIYYDLLGKYDLAAGSFQHSLTIRRKSLGLNHSSVAKSLNSIGICYLYKGDYDLAISYHQKALAICRENGYTFLMGPCMNNLGICYHRKGDYTLSLDYYQKALVIRKESWGQEHPSVALRLNNIGICYDSKGDYDLALKYHQEALTIYKKSLGETHINVTMSLVNIGRCYMLKGDYDLAIDHLQTSLDICKKQLGEHHPNIAYSLQAIGNTYFAKQEYELAIDYVQKSLIVSKKSLGEEHPEVAKTLNSLGFFHTAKGDSKSAIPFHQEALAIYKKKFGKEHPEAAKSLNSLGNCCADLEDYEPSIAYFQEALIALSASFHQKNIYLNPNFQRYSDGYAFLNAFYGKAIVLRHLYELENQNLKHLQAALSTLSLATNLVADIRQSYKAEGSKHTLAEEAAKTFNQAIETALTTVSVYEQLTKIPSHKEFTNIPYTIEATKNLVFDFAEQSKAILLLSNLKDSEAKTEANIPFELLEKERQLKIELNYLDKNILTQTAKGEEKDEELLNKFQRQYFEQKQQYDALIEQFETDYPEYYQLKYSLSTASIQDLQNYLQKQEATLQPFSHSTIKQPNHSALLSYHLTEDKIYIFAIRSHDYQIAVVPKPEDFSDSLEELQVAIEVGNLESFVEYATQLFDLLLRPVWNHLQGVSKLIFIPHDELFYLPFDVLLNQDQITDSSSFGNLPYLIRGFDISYHYSATMLLHSHKRQAQTSKQIDSFFGLAPIQFGTSLYPSKGGNSLKKEGYIVKSSSQGGKIRTRILKSSVDAQIALQDLEETEAEVKEVYQLFEQEGKEAIALFYDQANKENLQEYIGGYKYVLISTHGFLQETGKNTLSGIHLAPQKRQTGLEAQSDEFILHTSETYHLNLNADLVVLSSCESGIGELKVGEGMMA